MSGDYVYNSILSPSISPTAVCVVYVVYANWIIAFLLDSLTIYNCLLVTFFVRSFRFFVFSATYVHYS